MARDYHAKALELTESVRARIFDQGLRASYLAQRQDEYELYTDLLMQLHQQQPNAGHADAALEISERGRARSLLETLSEARVEIRSRVSTPLYSPRSANWANGSALKEQQRTQLIGNLPAAKQAEASGQGDRRTAQRSINRCKPAYSHSQSRATRH